MDSKDQHDNKDSRRQLTTSRDQRGDGSHSDCHTTSQHVCQSASQPGHNTSRKRNLDVRTQHPDTSSQHNHDAQLRGAVSDGRWWDVPDLITSDVSDACRAWAVEEACRHADDTLIGVSILPGCTHELLSSVVPVLVRRGLWRAVCQSLDRGVGNEQGRSAVETASEEADEDSVLLLLPYCPDDLLDTVLVQVTRRGLWHAVIAVLQRGVSDTQKKFAVEAASEKADEDSVLLLLPFCPDDLLDTVLVQVTKRGLWHAVIALLQRGVSDIERKWAVQAACGRADEHHLTHGILGHCHDDQMDSVLTRLVERSLWDAARWLLAQSRDGELSTCIGTDTTQHTPAATEDDGDGQTSVSSILITAVRRGLWSAVRALLQHISHTTQTHPTWRGDAFEHIAVLEEAFWRCMEITDYISSSDTERWAVEEACKRADDEDCVAIVDVCAVDQLNTMLTEAVRRGLWKTVIWLLARIRIRDPRDAHRITVEEACAGTEDDGCLAVIRFSTHDQRHAVILDAIENRLYEKTNNDSEACKRTDDGECLAVCFSTQAQRDAVMTEAVRRGLCERIDDDSGASDTQRWTVRTGMWAGVRDIDAICKLQTLCTLLQTVNHHIHNTSDIERWAVEQACKRAGDDQCKDIVYFCDKSQFNTILTEAVSRGLWKTVVRLLVKLQVTQFLFDPVICRSVSDSWRWAVEDAWKCSSDADRKHIVQLFDKDQLGTLLTEAVRRGLWKTVTCLMYRIKRERVSNVDYARRRAVEEACTRADDPDLKMIVYFCDDNQRETVLTQAVTRGLLETVTGLLEFSYINNPNGLKWAPVKPDLNPCSSGTQVRLVRLRPDGTEEWDPEQIDVDACASYKHAGRVARLLGKREVYDQASKIVRLYVRGEKSSTEEVLVHWAQLFVDSLSVQFDLDANAHLEPHKDLQGIRHIIDEGARTAIDSIRLDHIDQLTNFSTISYHQDTVSAAPESTVWHKMYTVLREKSVQNIDVYPHFFKWCVQRKGGTTSLCQLSLPLIATQTVNPALQSLARTSMWEETRRWYLQFLVEEKLWAVVKEVADHSVYDDQRAWALEQARHHKQWDVVVHLADHGLTDNHRWRVYRQVAKYADWDAVRLLFKRGVDMRRVCEELMAANPSRERPPDNEADIERRRNRGEDVSKLEAEYRERSERVARLALEHKQRCRELDTLEKRQAGRRRDGKMSWYAVLSQLRQDVTEEGIAMTLRHAIQSEAWSVVVQLVRLGMEAAQRDCLFPETIRRRQWGVARALLEQGVSVELSRAALPELMETDQWILVARVMEQSLDDTDRRRVMQAALGKKEGSVVAHGISVMEGRLSVEERQTMYDQALSQGVWQAVRRLVEEKDNTGIAQRDEALVAAVDNHRWDIVEHCVLQGADINRRNADGDTMLHEKAKRKNWESVDALVHYGADPNMTDSEGYSAFHITVNGTEHLWIDKHSEDPWVAVKTSVKFHGNLNRPDPKGRTPLHTLINYYDSDKAAEILDEALWWGSDVAQGQRVDSQGRTVLHLMCEAGRWKSIQYVLARGVHPLAVTKGGDTALAVAVKYEKDWKLYEEQFGLDEGLIKWDAESRECRQKLVAECIKLGISTHQPPITDSKTDIKSEIWDDDIESDNLNDDIESDNLNDDIESDNLNDDIESDNLNDDIESDSLDDDIESDYINILCSDLVDLHMLYESGACSHRQLRAVLDQSPHPSYLDTRLSKYNKDLCEKIKCRYKQCRSELRKVATTPRSLQSTCRLVISHHLGICKPRTRQKRVKQLRLSDIMKDYVIFSDLVDPDKVKDIVTQTTSENDIKSDDLDEDIESVNLDDDIVTTGMMRQRVTSEMMTESDNLDDDKESDTMHDDIESDSWDDDIESDILDDVIDSNILDDDIESDNLNDDIDCDNWDYKIEIDSWDDGSE